jgi:D-alanyl-lipoteichoic acid acyltransferase DltB (MBOAT superfamily)
MLLPCGFISISPATDIAIGLGNLLGIHLPENFLRPISRPI